MIKREANVDIVGVEEAIVVMQQMIIAMKERKGGTSQNEGGRLLERVQGELVIGSYLRSLLTAAVIVMRYVGEEKVKKDQI